jgi:hypothetical protein
MRCAVLLAGLCFVFTARADDFLDHVSDALTFSALNDAVRARLSGRLDLEGYQFEQPAPELINSGSDALFNPRLSLFLDGQVGSQIYVFAQARVDRGFDPADDSLQARMDEYAVRLTPWHDGRLAIQIGKFATVVGNFVPRHLSWENPFIDAPLAYENVTALEDRTGHIAARFHQALLSEKYEFVPVIWGPSYATGASLAGKIEKFDYAVELKNASVSSRPEMWSLEARGFDDPTVSGRAGFRPSEMWNIGLSVSDGAYLREDAGRFLPRDKAIGDFHEKLIGQDLAFAWHHLQIWAEVYEARFEVPRYGHADTVAWYIEAKYKFAPQFFAAVRFNQQLFDQIDNGRVTADSLGTDLWRLDAAVAYRFTAHTQLKLQYSFEKETSAPRENNHLFGTQLTVRF